MSLRKGVTLDRRSSPGDQAVVAGLDFSLSCPPDCHRCMGGLVSPARSCRGWFAARFKPRLDAFHVALRGILGPTLNRYNAVRYNAVVISTAVTVGRGKFALFRV